MSTNRFYSFYRHGKRFDITMFNDDEFRTLLGHLDRPWQGYRKVRKGVKKRLSRRMDEIGCRTIADYLEVLNRSPEEKDACEQCLLVTISRYFRDRQLWQTLKERLLPLLVQRFEPPIRIWCAGCACGEEAYSLAIVLDSMENSPIVELLATDTQNACLDRAGKGLYGHSSLKEVPVDLRAAYFVSMRGGRSFKIRKNRLPPIQWQQHNLLDPPPPGPFQMILMRNNLLTYHQGPLLRAAFDRITATLPPGGYLVVGSHEKLPASTSTFIRDPQCPWVYSMNHL
ncbi:MAG: CheR family methyltransferase [Desulfobacteraceae bacterium]